MRTDPKQANDIANYRALVLYDFDAMTQMDWETERRRLADLYARMEEAELEELAAHGETLTDVAKEVLRSEISGRGMSTVLRASKPNDSKKSNPPVMIRRYQDLPEALLSKSILDSAGIQSFLADENLVRIDWFYSNLIGGIKLLVRGEDAETAIKLLEQGTPQNFQVDGVGEYRQPRCPRCRSLNVDLDELNKRIAYGGMLFAGIPMPSTNEHWKCPSCGHEWEDEDANHAGNKGEID